MKYKNLEKLVKINNFNALNHEIRNLEEQEKEFETRSLNVEKIFEELTEKRNEGNLISEEETKAFEEEAEEVSKSINSIQEKIKELKNKADELEAEIEESNNKIDEEELKQESISKKKEERNDGGLKNKMTVRTNNSQELEIRSLVREAVKEERNTDWLKRFANNVVEQRAFVGEDTLIPEDIEYIARIKSLSDQSAIYNEVDKRTGKGKSRTYVTVDPAVFVWAEKRAASKEVELALTNPVELDAYLLSGYVSVYNYDLEESMVNLADLVTDALAYGFVKARENAILSGKGQASNEPTGIINTEGVKTASATSIKELLEAFSDLGGDDGYDGEAIAVINPKTYKKLIVPNLLTFTDGGQLVAKGDSGVLPDGTRVVKSFACPVGKVVYGVFKDYIYRETKGVEIKPLYEIKALDNQTVIKLDSRADGKVKRPENFMIIDFTAADEEVSG